MRYDVEADWKLLDSCNYRCAYCFYSHESLGRKVVGLPRPEQWISAFAITGKTWLLHITGGEPTIYPGFGDLCAGLAERHYLSLNTNLTQASIGEFAERVDPSRVSLVHVAIHPAERERRQGWELMLGNLELLKRHGHPVMTSVVATSEALERFEDIASELAPSGFRPVPKSLRGPYEGRNYPAAYSVTDRQRFKLVAAWAREGYRELEAAVSEQPTIWPLYDDRKLGGTPRFRGENCASGHLFVAIHPDGATYRCGTDTPLGNVLEGTLALRDGPGLCATSYCPYFCAKYTRPLYFDFGKSPARRAPARAVLSQ